MTEKEEKHEGSRRYPSLTWPIILITAGILFLLSNLGVLDIDFFSLWRLWPVLLILAGLEIILGRRSAIGNIIVLIATLAVIGGVIFLLIAAPDVLGTSTGAVGVTQIDEPLDGVERAELDIGFAAGQIDISKLTDSSSLIKGELDLSTRREPTWEISRSDSQASMTLEYAQGAWTQNWQKGDVWELFLSPKVGLSLDVSMGAGDANMDLTGLDIRELKIETGAGRSTVTLPEDGDFSAQASSGVGQLIIEIPEGMAARVQIDRGIGDVSVSGRFSRDGNTYVTDDWRSNENRVDLEIDIGVGQVTVREP